VKRTPVLWSQAFEDVPAPDYADVLVRVLPPGAPADPELWARELFSVSSMPFWVRVLLIVRQLLVPLIGVHRAGRNIFAVQRVSGDEALVAADEEHLSFRCGVGVDAEARLVRVVTAVTLNGRRGRLYFRPVALVHPAVVSAMLASTCRRLAGP
jgi:hypothetical protein